MRKVIILSIFLSKWIGGICQDQLRNISPIQQTPNVTAMAKFGDIPVGHYSGTTMLNIPLYTIKVKQVELPIAISYNSSGIKVAEEAGPVGLGWSINLGGIVSQVVNDRNDLSDPQFMDVGYVDISMPNHGNLADEIYSNSVCNTDSVYFPFVNRIGHSNQESGVPRFFYNCVLDNSQMPFDPFASDWDDTEPDYFTFNFGNYSGKFFYDRNSGTFQTIDRSKLRIVYTPAIDSYDTGSHSGWTITTDDGTVYKFFKAERHRGASAQIGTVPSGSMSPDFNNYHLTSVVLTSGETIELSYTSGLPVCLLASVSESHTLVDGNTTYYSSNDTYVQANFPFYTASLSQRQYIPVHLDTISFPGGRVLFSWNSRADILNERRLTKVEVVNSQNEIVRTITFDNAGYFQGIDSPKPNFLYYNGGTLSPCDCSSAGLTAADVQLKRLKLTSVTLSDQENPYRFYYNESTNLPAKMAYASDYWGYYNGNSGASSYLPDLRRLYLVTPPELSSGIAAGYESGHDRRANLIYAKSWILNKVTYPTGGNTEFEYELNTFDNYDFAAVGDYEDRQAYANTTYYGQPGNISTSGTSSTTFSINIQQTVKVNWKFDLRLMDNSNPNLNYRAQILDGSSNVIFERKFREWNDPIPTSENCTKPTLSANVTLAPGNYTARLLIDGNIVTCVHTGNASSSTMSVSVIYRYIGDLANYHSRGAGLRIRSITDNDGSSNAITKLYQYTGGQLMDFPNFYRKSKLYKWEALGISSPIVGMTSYNDKITFSGNSISGIATGPRGNYVGYAQVRESMIHDNMENGYRLLHFFNSSLDCNSSSLAPCTDRISNGLLMREEMYNSTGIKVQMTSNSYEYADEVQGYGIIGEPSYYGAGGPTYLLHTYPVIGGRERLLSSTRTTFSSGQSFVEATDYTYNSNHDVSTKTTKQSDGSTLIQRFYYPADKSSPVYIGMVAKNQINSLVAKEESVTRLGVNQLTKLENWNFTSINGVGVLSSYENSFGGSANLVNRFSILSFDNKNNPVEVLEGNGLVALYRYDAFNNPVLKALNAAASQVYYEGFSSGNTTVGKIGGGYYGSQFHVPFVVPNDGKTYFIDFWYQLNDVWYFKKEPFQNGYVIPYFTIDEVRVYPENSLVTSYTYKPLVGITSVQDVNGEFIHYHYDSQNRLSHISDNKGDIITAYEYHFKR